MSDASVPMSDAVASVPTNIITGYAAAGKTHLLNLLLRHCASAAMAAGVIVHRQAVAGGGGLVRKHAADGHGADAQALVRRLEGGGRLGHAGW